MVSFALEMKGLTEGFMAMNLDYGSMQANGVIHGGRSPGAGSDGMAAMFYYSYIIDICLVS